LTLAFARAGGFAAHRGSRVASAERPYNAQMRFRLRTLLIVLALGPPALWCVWAAIRSLVAAALLIDPHDYRFP
jgi:hypothetical protein